MRIIPFIILCSIFVSEVIATASKPNNAQKEPEKTIPFIIEKRSPITSGDQFKGLNSQALSDYLKLFKNGDTEATPEALPIPVSTIISVIETFKKDICPSNKGGTFEITLKLDSSMKVLGVGLSSEGGLKATINCDKP